MTIAIALQHRLIEAARRDLGPDGELIVREVIRRALGSELEEVGYRQLPRVFDAIEREGALAAGRAAAATLAEELNRLQVQVDASLGERLLQALADGLGRAAEPCLAHVCQTLGLTPDRLDRTHLPQIAAAIRRDGAALLGPAAAERIAATVTDTRRNRPPGLAMLVIDVAAEYLGPEGERVLRDLCQEQLETDLDALEIDGIGSLAAVVLRHGAARIGAARIAAFLDAAQQAVLGPGEQLRSQVLEQAKHHLGPAGPVFVRRACEHHEMPMEAVSYEHLIWLAEVMYEEAVPLVGERDARAFAAAIQRLLPADAGTLGNLDSAPLHRVSAPAMTYDPLARGGA